MRETHLTTSPRSEKRTRSMPTWLATPMGLLWKACMRTHARWLFAKPALELCCVGEYEGIRICDFAGEPQQREAFLAKTAEALDLLRNVDPRRFRRVRRYVSHIGLVTSRQLRGGIGGYDVYLHICYVCAGTYGGGTEGGRSEQEQQTAAVLEADCHLDHEARCAEYRARCETYEARLTEFERRQIEEHDPREREALSREYEALLRERADLVREEEARDPIWTLISYAATLVHEATHGLVEARGVPYLRHTHRRIEQLCHLEERRFLESHWPWTAGYLPLEPEEHWYLKDSEWPLLSRLLSRFG
jgi:hypothetical protein